MKKDIENNEYKKANLAMVLPRKKSEIPKSHPEFTV